MKKALWLFVKISIQHFFFNEKVGVTPSVLTGALKAGKGGGSQCSDKQKGAWAAGR